MNETSDLHEHGHEQNRFAVIPTPQKLDANPNITGRGVTVAFLDSGFYPHPDIATRIDAFHDVTGSENDLASIEVSGHHWHGTQTVVACAGDGVLSDGTYRGLASEARLVLVKVSDKGRIADSSIEAGLEWVIENRERYNIRVLNMSLGGDLDLPTAESRINALSTQLVDAGVVVTVAAGNSAETNSIPPANSPSVITVGGYSDENQFDADGFDLYHSSYGKTADGLIKPELIAPAMYVAAPILPETEDYRIAETLSELAKAPDYDLERKIASVDIPLETARSDIRASIDAELRRRKVVATHYQHVDGTSFAAPITASIVAQMLEANPELTPAAIKNILVSTASRLSGHDHVRQGFGVVNARLAVERAASETHFVESEHYFPPRIEANRIVFCYHDDHANDVALCGDFNDWSATATPFVQQSDGLWQVDIPCQGAGTYQYKFLVDQNRWTEDPSHALKADDGVGGLNSLLIVV